MKMPYKTLSAIALTLTVVTTPVVAKEATQEQSLEGWFKNVFVVYSGIWRGPR